MLWPLLMDNFAGDTISRPRSLGVHDPTASRRFETRPIKEIGQAVWSVNPNLPLASVRTLQDHLRPIRWRRTSFTLVMLAIAGGMALLLGSAGIYGVISYSVAQRTREIGIRMALGARAQDVAGMFVRYGFRLAAIGSPAALPRQPRPLA